VEAADVTFVFGVQWHPEDLTNSDWHMRRLFESLLRAAAEWRRGAGPC